MERDPFDEPFETEGIGLDDVDLEDLEDDDALEDEDELDLDD